MITQKEFRTEIALFIEYLKETRGILSQEETHQLIKDYVIYLKKRQLKKYVESFQDK